MHSYLLATLVAAKVWHFWLGVFQVIPAILLIVAIGVLYVVKVLSKKYPPQ